MGGDKSEAIFCREAIRGVVFAARQRFTSIGPLGKRKEPKPEPYGPDIFGWGGGLPREGGGGARKFGVSFETQGDQNFWVGYPEILPGYPGKISKSLRKRFVFNSRPLFPQIERRFWLRFHSSSVPGTKKDWEWQCSNERSHEQFGTM